MKVPNSIRGRFHCAPYRWSRSCLLRRELAGRHLLKRDSGVVGCRYSSERKQQLSLQCLGLELWTAFS